MPSFLKGDSGTCDDLEDDDQYFNWLGNDEGAAADGSNLSKHNNNADQPGHGLLEDSPAEKDGGLHCARGNELVEGSQENIIDAEMECFTKEENMIQSNIVEEPNVNICVGAAAGSEQASRIKGGISSNRVPLGKEDMFFFFF